jgi:protein transport protein YIF1
MGSLSSTTNEENREINTPDLYIPIMSFFTYVLFVSFIMGLEDKFNPQILITIAQRGFIIILLEFLVIKLGFYLLQAPTSINFLDTISISGYKYVGITFSAIFTSIFGNLAYYISTLYFMFAFMIFMLKTLRIALYKGIILLKKMTDKKFWMNNIIQGNIFYL